MADISSLLPNSAQFGRACSLIVYGLTQQGLDLSALRIKFSVKRSTTMTPNTADIRVYNVSDQTAQFIKTTYSPSLSSGFIASNRGRVILQAGYVGNFGVIFQGNIKQIILGRENATETYVDIIAGDGDRAYNYAVVNKTLAAGSSQMDQVSAALTPMNAKGVTQGYVQLNSFTRLPRAKVMYGNSINYLRNVGQATNQDFSIQDEAVTFVSLTSFLPGTVVVLNSNTGMIGTPQQTDEGINVRCLINPLLKIGGRIQLNNSSIQGLKINLNATNTSVKVPTPFNTDGVYFILVVEHIGDTRGLDWYSNLVTLSVAITTNPLNSVQAGYGDLT